MVRTEGGHPERRRGILAVVAVVVLLALGFGVAAAVGDALGIRSEPSARMQEEPGAAPVTDAVRPPLLSVSAPGGERMRVALDELAAATEGVTTDGQATLTVVSAGEAGEDDAYALSGGPSELRIEAATEAGAVRGVYDVASAIRQGRDIRADLGRTVTSRLSLRMADLGAVGVAADPAEWRDGTDYSHASKAFADVVLPRAPYVDEQALAAAYADFDDYPRRMLAEGYNALAFPGFIEFTTFVGVDGVYADGDEHVARALAMRAAFAPFWQRAQQLGVKVYLRTDMLALTSPLENYLRDRFGGLDTEDPALWSVYAAGLDELYRAEPALSGVLIRIGEAGRV